ncbi:MAG: signal peptidase I [Clostridiaceae bacterium]|nr:signal peptidase I [Clostridiaceae bacterium]
MTKKISALNEEKNYNESSDKILILLEWLRTFLFVILIGLFLTVFVIQRNIIQGPSMEPTLYNKDQIFVEKISKYFSIERGDIITLSDSETANQETLLIKRVIGLPGENIKIESGQVYINDELLRETYLADGVKTYTDETLDISEITLAENEYFVLGDNRPVSKDSRRIGPINKNQIIGKLLIKFYPFNEIGVPK